MSMKNLITIVFLAGLIFFPKTNFGQLPDLGILYNFVLFTSNGSIPNTGQSIVLGNIGSNGGGTVTGFGSPSIVSGTIYQSDPTTAQGAKDLLLAYNDLYTRTATMAGGVVLVGSTVNPGVYSQGGAGSLAGNITLDAKGDSNALFIFITGGALTIGAGTSISLINNASAANVFWVANGAISMATMSTIKGTMIANGAISIGANCNTEGRMFSIDGALPTYNLTAVLPLDYSTTIWTGAGGTNKWFTASNWTHNIPASFVNALIPSTLFAGRLFPLLDSGTAIVDSLTIVSPGSLVVLSTLHVKGAIISSGTFDMSNGTLEMNGTVAQVLASGLFTGNTISNLILSNNTTLSGPLSIAGTLSFSGSNDTLTTGGYLTLKSTASGTARIADLTNASQNTGNAIIGTVTIERYIPRKRAWRLLSAPVAAMGAPTINAAWQEGNGGTANSSVSGYGTQITGGSAISGFDQNITGNPSVKVFINESNTVVGLPATTGTNVPISTYPGYFIFVRGDRETNLMQGTNAALSNTTLRIIGQTNKDSIASAINAAGITMVGNPYCSTINFDLLSKINVASKFYVWDAQTVGSLGYGGYVTVSKNGATYDVSPAGTTVTQYIASGAAFFTESSNGLKGLLTIKEADKSSGGSDQLFKEIESPVGKVAVNLLNSDSSLSLIDGILTTYDKNSDNAVNRLDSKKMYNLAEIIAIGRDSSFLSIERRHTIADNDTTLLKLYRLKPKTYTLMITTSALDGNGLSGQIKDSYSATINNTFIKLNGNTAITFTVNADSASFAANRFSIVFKRTIPTIVTYKDVRACNQQNNIVVSWNNATEKNIRNYNVQEQQSTNDSSFVEVATIAAKLNNDGIANYSWLDVTAQVGTHYYRIKATDVQGNVTYSSIVNATIRNNAGPVPSIRIHGNIVHGNTVTLAFINVKAGVNTALLYNLQGQLIKEFKIAHGGENISLHNININRNLATGWYQLKVSGKSINIKVPFFKQQ